MEEKLEEKISSTKINYDQNKCKKKKISKEHYQCKEYEKCHDCALAVTMNQQYYCPIKK
jgi:hypothetical protein